MHDVSARRVSRNLTSDRTLRILGLFTVERTSITTDDLLTELGMSRATAYRYIQSLVREGFLESAPDGSLRLGGRVFDLARVARRGYTLPALAAPIMESLAAEHREVVLLTSLMNDSVACLERTGWQTRVEHITYEPGVAMPLNAGASALVLLAWKPDDEIETLLRRPLGYFNSHTIVDRAEIRKSLKEIRSSGTAITVSDVDEDAVGVAVPVVSGGQVVAGLSLVAPHVTFNTARLRRAEADLRAAAEAIARKHAHAHTL